MGSDYCSRPGSHEYELYLAIENIDHDKTKTSHPQNNGIYECFNNDTH